MKGDSRRKICLKKVELCRAYGLIQGITEAIKCWEDFNKQGLIKVLEEVEEILKKHTGVK